METESSSRLCICPTLRAIWSLFGIGSVFFPWRRVVHDWDFYSLLVRNFFFRAWRCEDLVPDSIGNELSERMHANLAHDFRPLGLRSWCAGPQAKDRAWRQPNDVTADAPGFLGAGPTAEVHASVRPAIARYPSSIPMQSGTLYCRSEQRCNVPTPASN